MTDAARSNAGFIGLGTMGGPMALNLRRAGVPLVVWNRTAAKAAALVDAGAELAASVDDVFARSRIIFLMLSNDAVVDEVLGRHGSGFAAMVRGVTIVQMGTTPPEHSAALCRDVEMAGGDYVEAPVSGQRGPAEAGRLVAMVAGRAAPIGRVRPLLAPMCHEIVACGDVPGALALKLASNHYVATMLIALAETINFARMAGVDLDLLSSLLCVGPMSSDLLRMKLPKLIAGDFDAQASLGNVSDVFEALTAAGRRCGAATPVLDACVPLCGEAMNLGLREDDVTGIIRAIEARSARSGS